MHLPEIPVDEFFVTILISYFENISVYINYHLPLMKTTLFDACVNLKRH